MSLLFSDLTLENTLGNVRLATKAKQLRLDPSVDTNSNKQSSSKDCLPVKSLQESFARDWSVRFVEGLSGDIRLTLSDSRIDGINSNILPRHQMPGEVVYIEGSISALLEVPCSRCGEPMEFSLKQEFTRTVRKVSGPYAGQGKSHGHSSTNHEAKNITVEVSRPRDLSEEDLDTYEVDSAEIPIEQIIYDAMNEAIPHFMSHDSDCSTAAISASAGEPTQKLQRHGGEKSLGPVGGLSKGPFSHSLGDAFLAAKKSLADSGLRTFSRDKASIVTHVP